MGKIKAIVLVLVLMFTSILLTEQASSVSATPSVPEFTVKFIDNSYDVPAEYEIDQFTGENVMVKPGEHVENMSIELTVTNPASLGNGGLYYNFRFKGPYGDAWSYYPFNPDGRSTIPYNGQSWGSGNLSPKLEASQTAYTTITLPLNMLLSIASGYTGSVNVPKGGEIEFQIQALSGNIEIDPSGLLAGAHYDFTGQSSGWSTTQTVTLSESSNPANEPTPTVPEISTLIILPLLATMSLIITAVLRKKRFSTYPL